MKWEMKVNPNTVGTRLRVRTGPSTSYRIVDYKYPNNEVIVVDSKTTNSSIWYKIEGTEYWLCGTDTNGSQYLLQTKDLEEKPATPEQPSQTEPKKEPEKVDITRPPVTPTMGAKQGSNNTSYITWDESWYKPMEFSMKVPECYATKSDTEIAQMIADLKHNMDIGYTSQNDIYNINVENASRGYSLESKGYFTDLQKKMYNSFNRNKTAFPDKELTKTFAYVFFTRPDLNILTRASGTTNFTLVKDQTDGDPKFMYLWKNNPWCLKSLISSGNPYHKWMVFLSNEALSFEVSDVVIKTVEHGETYNGNKIIYGFSDQESNAASEFSVRYVDTVNLDVFKLHLAWTDYINKVSRGIFEPKREYMMDRILDYACSCYYFLCGPDGSTILFWQKLTGVFPVNTGESAFSWDSGNLLAKPEINIKYMYSFKSSMDMHSLSEFNDLSSQSTTAKKILDAESGYAQGDYGIMTGSTLTHAPRVWRHVDVAGNTVFRLVWVENS